MSEALAPEDVARELEAHRARKAEFLHEHYDVEQGEQGEQHIAELQAKLSREKGVLDSLRARLLDQLRQEVGAASASEPEAALRARYDSMRARLAASATADDIEAAARKIEQLASLEKALSFFVLVSSLRPPAPCAHTTDAFCPRCCDAVERDARKLARVCEEMGAATVASLPSEAQKHIYGTANALRNAAFGMARRALETSRWPNISVAGEHTGMQAQPMSKDTTEAFKRLFMLCELCDATCLRWCSHTRSLQEGDSDKDDTQEEAEDEQQQSHLEVVRELVVPPITERFRFHFCGNKATAALPCLRWALQFITDTLRQVAPFVQAAIQPACPSVNVLREIGAALVGLATQKIAGAINEYTPTPGSDYATLDALVIHCVNELVVYERAVQRTPVLSRIGLPSLIGAVFAAPDARAQHDTLLQRWVAAERAVAERTLRALAAQQDGAASWDTDPTSEFGAPALAEATTELAFAVAARYTLLPDAGARTAFVVQYQVPVFASFLEELTDALFRAKGSPPLLVARLCTLGRGCAHCEDALWDWVQDELPVVVAEDGDALAAASQIAHRFTRIRKDIVKRVVELALEPLCATVAQLFRGSTLYGTRAAAESAAAAKASPEASPEAASDGESAVFAEVSEQVAFALDNALPLLQQGLDNLAMLQIGGSDLCAQVVRRACERVAAAFVDGLAKEPQQRVLSPRAVQQLCADMGAVRAALVALDADTAAKHLAPLQVCEDALYKRRPAAGVLPDTTVALLARLNIST